MLVPWYIGVGMGELPSSSFSTHAVVAIIAFSLFPELFKDFSTPSLCLVSSSFANSCKMFDDETTAGNCSRFVFNWLVEATPAAAFTCLSARDGVDEAVFVFGFAEATFLFADCVLVGTLVVGFFEDVLDGVSTFRSTGISAASTFFGRPRF